MEQARVELVQYRDIPIAYMEVERLGLFDKAINKMKRREFDKDDILEWLIDGEVHLWLLKVKRKISAFALTNICRYPQYSGLNVLLLGGDMRHTENYCELIRQMETWALDIGCTWLEARTRPGLTKKLMANHKFIKLNDLVAKEI